MRARQRYIAQITHVRRLILVVVAGGLTLYGCRIETLYDPVNPDRTAPDVAVQLPIAGSSTQSGQRVPIRVAASDSIGVVSISLSVSGVLSESIAVDYSPPSTAVLLDTAVVVPVDSVGSLVIDASATNTRGVTGKAPAVIVTVTAAAPVAAKQ